MQLLDQPFATATGAPVTTALRARDVTRIYGKDESRVVALRSVTVDIAAGRLMAIVAVALACGLLASVLPARGAAHVDPIIALADA